MSANDPSTVQQQQQLQQHQRKQVHFHDDTQVQIVGEFTCLSNALGAENELSDKEEKESSFITCLRTECNQIASSAKTSNPDLLECSSSDYKSNGIDTSLDHSHQLHQQNLQLQTQPLITQAQQHHHFQPQSHHHHQHFHQQHPQLSQHHHNVSTVSCVVDPCKYTLQHATVITDETITLCPQCDYCAGTAASTVSCVGNNLISKSIVDYTQSELSPVDQTSPFPSSSLTNSTTTTSQTTNSTSSNGGNNIYSFVPFLLVTGILSITLALLVSVSIIYIQCKYSTMLYNNHVSRWIGMHRIQACCALLKVCKTSIVMSKS